MDVDPTGGRGAIVAEWERGPRWFRRWACGCSEYHQGHKPGRRWVRLRWCAKHAPRGTRWRWLDVAAAPLPRPSSQAPPD